MELTNEIKARIFGQYLFCPMLRNKNIEGNDVIVQVIPEYIDDILEAVYDYKLILTPLSEITDEDLKELGDLCGIVGEVIIWIRGDYSVTICNTIKSRMVKIYYSGSNSRIIDKGFEIIEYNTLITDYLRSKGYMVPYMGIDLYEAGIAIKPIKYGK